MSTTSYSLDNEHLSYMTMLWLKQSHRVLHAAGHWPGSGQDTVVGHET